MDRLEALDLCTQWNDLLSEAGISYDEAALSVGAHVDTVRGWCAQKGDDFWVVPRKRSKKLKELIVERDPTLETRADDLFKLTWRFKKNPKRSPVPVPPVPASPSSPLLYHLNGLLPQKRLLHVFTTKALGNVSIRRGHLDTARQNRKRLYDMHGILESSVTTLDPRHQGVVKTLAKEDIGGYLRCDALISTFPDAFLLLTVADAAPVIFYSREPEVIALACAGWESAHHAVITNTLKRMEAEHGVDLRQVQIGIGPSIHRDSYAQPLVCCTQADNPEWHPFLYRMDHTPEQVHVDLLGFIKFQVSSAGVPFRNVFLSNINTFDSDLFYSKRRHERDGSGAEYFGCFVGISSSAGQ